MHSQILVDGTDLMHWADRRDAQSFLPQLIRRLILATVEKITRIGFPSGEAVQLGGWDGILAVGDGTAFIPVGVSAWEMSTRTDIKAKADEDCKKRSDNPREVNPAESTFIFVTPRRWGGKNDWQREKQAEGIWREVRVYDADDLEQWLESAPGVHLWFSIMLGKNPKSALDLDSFWIDWSESTRPNMSSEFVLSGRDETVKRIHEWLHEPPGILSVQAETNREAIAVLAAILRKLPPDERDKYLSRAILVRDMSAWQQLVATCQNLILLPDFDVVESVTRALRSKHRVLVPLGRAAHATENTLIVPPISSEIAAKILVDSGVSEEDARKLVKLARRSLVSFRRKLAVSPEVHQPRWAKPGEARVLVPVMLAGAWDSSNTNDREVIAAVAQTTYEDVDQEIVSRANDSDPPVRRIGSNWFLVSIEDVWSLLSRYMTQDDFERFENAALEVLGNPNPRFDLPEEKRWMAGALGHSPKYSEFLRKGIAETLAIMGARESSQLLSDGISSQEWAKRIARKILRRANADWRMWASLSNYLSLIAEAAPDIFLSAVEKGLEGDSPVLLNLFTDQEDALFSSSPHTGLLWALETLAWSPKYLGHSASLLAKLAHLDPGGKLSNRPQNSLRDIFLLWNPQTAATLEQRLRVIDRFREHERDLAWELLKKLMPETSGFGRYTPKPSFREWAFDYSPRVTNKEYFEGIQNVARRIAEDAGEIGTRWSEIVGLLPEFPFDLRNEIIGRLETMDVECFQIDDRKAICNALRCLVSRHRSFLEEHWSLSSEVSKRLEEIYYRFEPKDMTAKYAWLFSGFPVVLEGLERDWKSQQKAVEEAQLQAILDTYDTAGFDGITRLMEQASRPDQVGLTLGKSEITLDDEDELLHKYLVSDRPEELEFARGFVIGRICKSGPEWVEQKLIKTSEKWLPQAHAELIARLPCDERAWDLADGLSPETNQQYWSLVSPYMINETGMERATRQLLKYCRPHAAIDFLATCMIKSKDIPATIVIDALEQSLQVSPEDDPLSQSFSYHIEQLFGSLYASKEEIDKGRIARLEWGFLTVLRRNRRVPRFLHEELMNNPEFFVEVVKLVYRAKGEEPRELTEEEQARAMNAYRLLESCRGVPGTTAGEDIGVQKCKNWVQRVRKELSAQGRKTAGDEVIGQVLSGAPEGDDNAWPHKAVREVIEEIRSEELERGFEIGVYNSRGIISRDLTAGGDLERELADKYDGFADTLNDNWPRTASVLRRIAEVYRREAQREDRDAKIREDWD